MGNSLKDQHYKNMDIRPEMDTSTFEAESIAYVVCQHFGIDTTDYSLAYVASWSKGTELAELKASLNVIHSTAGEIIDAISPPPPKMERTQEQRPRQKGNRRTQKARR